MKKAYIANGTSRKRAALALAMVATLSACSGGFLGQSANGISVQNEEPLVNYTPAQIFERGEFELENNRADDAAFYLGEIERLYPYSEFAKRALIMQAFAFHRDKEYPDSRSAA